MLNKFASPACVELIYKADDVFGYKFEALKFIFASVLPHKLCQLQSVWLDVVAVANWDFVLLLPKTLTYLRLSKLKNETGTMPGVHGCRKEKQD